MSVPLIVVTSTALPSVYVKTVESLAEFWTVTESVAVSIFALGIINRWVSSAEFTVYDLERILPSLTSTAVAVYVPVDDLGTLVVVLVTNLWLIPLMLEVNLVSLAIVSVVGVPVGVKVKLSLLLVI